MIGKSSLQEIATLAIIREISDSNLETRRYSKTVFENFKLIFYVRLTFLIRHLLDGKCS